MCEKRKKVGSCYGVPAVLVGFVMRLLKISSNEPDHEILDNIHTGCLYMSDFFKVKTVRLIKVFQVTQICPPP